MGGMLFLVSSRNNLLQSLCKHLEGKDYSINPPIIVHTNITQILFNSCTVHKYSK